MRNISLDLSREALFKEDFLLIDKNVTFIFGKNGTGKTTLARLIKDQVTDHNVRVFQGFDGLIGQKGRLNAVVLGEENNEIDKEIKSKKAEIEKKQVEIKDIESKIQELEENPTNLEASFKKKKEDYKKEESSLQSFRKKAASEIKNMTNPQIASPNYDIRAFVEEIGTAQLLSDDEILRLKDTVKSDLKNAKSIPVSDFELEEKLRVLNELLQHRVEAKVIIKRLVDDKKRAFAKEGLAIHKPGDKCAFCEGDISLETMKELESYFSADEVQEFEKKLRSFIEQVEASISCLKQIVIKKDDFYPEEHKELEEIEKEFLHQTGVVSAYLNQLKCSAEEKLKQIYEVTNQLEIKAPQSLNSVIMQYNDLVKKNNSSNLLEQQEASKERLRKHEIKKLLNKFEYDVHVARFEELKKAYNEACLRLEAENKKIQEKETQIRAIEGEILELQAKTRNEKKLADKINKKLRLHVSFELVYLKDPESEQGFYQIKCHRTEEIREVNRLSTGEKNIIAFLYFVEKLNEIPAIDSLPKMVVFDDPMNSNDDSMQYLIIEELQALIKNKKRDDKIIIMTHNNHFYLNVKYERKYKTDKFIRLLSNGKTVNFMCLTDESEDFRTNYECLWKEVEFLYNNANSLPEILLNPIRRIIETFTKFNGIGKVRFYDEVSGAKKLFDVNSHSIDDLEADLGGKSKKEIIGIMRECFVKNSAEGHFKQFWTLKLN